MTNEMPGANAETPVIPTDAAANGEGQQINDEGEDGEGNDKGQRPAETPEARKARLERQLDQHKKKHPELYTDSSQKPAKKSDDFDYGQAAFLIANDIKDEAGQALAKKIMKETGKELKDVIGSSYFKSELKDLRETEATMNATPDGSKRTNQSSASTVEYWIAKGELPPASETKLRQEVVNARMKKESTGSQFTSNPVVQ